MSDTPDRPKSMWDQMSEPPPAGLPDAGPELLQKFRLDLQMDDEWTVLDGRTLSWWGGRLPMVISAEMPRLCEGDPTVKVTASVVMVQAVTVDDPVVARVLMQHNQDATVGAFTWQPETRQVVAQTTHYAYQDNSSLTHLFAPFALLLYTEALAATVDLARQLGGRPAIRPHPFTGYRTDVDGMLSVSHTLVIPQGEAPAAWSSQELASLSDQFTAARFSGSSDDSGVVAEFPLPRHVFSDRPETALFQLLPHRHPTYGTGLLALMHLPTLYEPPVAALLANRLNSAEFQELTGISGFGAWCTGAEGQSLVHTMFLPNMFATPGVASTIAWQACSRSRRATDWFAARRQDEAEDKTTYACDSTTEQSETDWTSGTVAVLAGLTADDIPSLEILFIDALGVWVFSAANPGQGYDVRHGGQMISLLISSVARSQRYRPARQPPVSADISEMRQRIVAGAHSIAAAEGGLPMLTARLMPAAIGELTNNRGEPGLQIYWIYIYGLLALAGGHDGTQNSDPIRAIMESFSEWNALMIDGFVPPSRQVPDELQ